MTVSERCEILVLQFNKTVLRANKSVSEGGSERKRRDLGAAVQQKGLGSLRANESSYEVAESERERVRA